MLILYMYIINLSPKIS